MKYLYILEGKTPKQVDNLHEWAELMETQDSIVQQTQIGNAMVSTVFLGLDYSLIGGKPLLFETMIFGSDSPRLIGRYSTWDEAEQGHQKTCEQVSKPEET